MRHISGLQAMLLVLCLAPTACMDGRNATTPGQLYHCGSDTDCLTGWACHCGYCQQPTFEQYTCSASGDDTSDDSHISADVSDASSGDVAATDSVSGSDAVNLDGIDVSSADVPIGTQLGVCNQSVSSDVIFAGCNLDTWQGCPVDDGCYYGPGVKLTLCKPHKTFAEGAACDPCNLTECGLTAGGHPLICDAVDKICRETCDATVVGSGVKPGQCPTGQQCYQLVDDQKVAYPSTGGICAP